MGAGPVEVCVRRAAQGCVVAHAAPCVQQAEACVRRAAQGSVVAHATPRPATRTSAWGKQTSLGRPLVARDYLQHELAGIILLGSSCPHLSKINAVAVMVPRIRRYGK